MWFFSRGVGGIFPSLNMHFTVRELSAKVILTEKKTLFQALLYKILNYKSKVLLGSRRECSVCFQFFSSAILPPTRLKLLA